MFLRASQNSQENICSRVSFFSKVVGLLKKETLAQVFSCEFSEIFKNTFFTEHLRATGSTYYKTIHNQSQKFWDQYPSPTNCNVVWRCDCNWVDSSCYPGSLYHRHNIVLGGGGIRIGIYCTLSNVLEMLSGFDQVSLATYFATDCSFRGFCLSFNFCEQTDFPQKKWRFPINLFIANVNKSAGRIFRKQVLHLYKRMVTT